MSTISAICKRDYCERKTYAQGFCHSHYIVAWRRGDTEPQYEQHGMWKSPEYKTWQYMIARCHSKSNSNYKHYGAKGVEVCDEWRNSFVAFYEYMGAKPSSKHSLDRIDVNGGYEPGNCRWATRRVQDINRHKRCDNTSGTTGVFFDNTKQRWKATINFDKKTVRLGSFLDKGAAIAARKAAEGRYFKPLLQTA